MDEVREEGGEKTKIAASPTTDGLFLKEYATKDVSTATRCHRILHNGL